MLVVDTSALDRQANMLAAAGHKARMAIRRSLRRVGTSTRAAMIAPLAQQTGLKPRVIRKALKVVLPSDDAVKIVSRGGRIRLKFFSARETRRGVSAAPRGNRQVFAGSFIKGGRFPNRKALRMGGHVFERLPGVKRWKGAIRVVRSDVTIPEEMVQGASAQAFVQTSGRVFAQRLSHELARVLQGFA